MKSTERIIKDIRFYEIKPKDFIGDFDGVIGNVYHITENTNSIGTYLGTQMPADDYWYVIKLEDNRIFKGHFALKR